MWAIVIIDATNREDFERVGPYAQSHKP